MARGPTKRNVDKQVHKIFLEQHGEDYRVQDRRLRFVAGVFLVLGFLVAFGAHQFGLPWPVTAAGIVVGAGTFFVCLWLASRLYKAEYRRFVLANMAEDGTFMYCPACGYDLRRGDAMYAAVCPECGARPWRFDRNTK